MVALLLEVIVKAALGDDLGVVLAQLLLQPSLAFIVFVL